MMMGDDEDSKPWSHACPLKLHRRRVGGALLSKRWGQFFKRRVKRERYDGGMCQFMRLCDWLYYAACL